MPIVYSEYGKCFSGNVRVSYTSCLNYSANVFTLKKKILKRRSEF